MASTFTPNAAFDYAKRYLKNMPLEQVQVQILDDVNKIMWMRAPWRWTVGAFPQVTLVSDQQDYTVALPSDFLYIQDMYITDQANTPPRVMHIEAVLPTGGKLGMPSRCAVSGTAGGSGTLRFLPKPGQVPTGWVTNGLYKKISPVVTQSNINTAGVLVFDDEWFWVYISGVLYFAYLFGDDQRAGGAQVSSNGQVQFTGQRGIFEANMEIMKQREKLAGIDPVMPETKEEA